MSCVSDFDETQASLESLGETFSKQETPKDKESSAACPAIDPLTQSTSSSAEVPVTLERLVRLEEAFLAEKRRAGELSTSTAQTLSLIVDRLATLNATNCANCRPYNHVKSGRGALADTPNQTVTNPFLQFLDAIP
ncbi:hypothetical protein GGF41_004663, partial [Coemansia sp. RSA 2531]